MSAVSIKLPDDLKKKALRLAKKKNVPLNGLVNYWLQTAVLQDETIEWMKRHLRGKNSELLINETFVKSRSSKLDLTKSGHRATKKFASAAAAIMLTVRQRKSERKKAPWPSSRPSFGVHHSRLVQVAHFCRATRRTPPSA